MDDTGNGKGETGIVIPAQHQPPLPLDRLILKESDILGVIEDDAEVRAKAA